MTRRKGTEKSLSSVLTTISTIMSILMSIVALTSAFITYSKTLVRKDEVKTMIEQRDERHKQEMADAAREVAKIRKLYQHLETELRIGILGDMLRQKSARLWELSDKLETEGAEMRKHEEAELVECIEALKLEIEALHVERELLIETNLKITRDNEQTEQKSPTTK